MTMFDGGLLARGWLSVALASSKDSHRPALDRTVSIELYDTGVRLVATDSYVLFRAWVPNLDHTDLDDLEARVTPEPDLDEAPLAISVAIDPHGRARGFLGHVNALSAKHHEHPDRHERPDVDLRLGVFDDIDDDQRRTFPGMDPEWVTLHLPDHELLKLQTFEGEFPNWRPLHTSFVPKRTTHVGLYPDRLGQIAKLSKYHTGAIGWTFGGAEKLARIAVLGSFPETQGLVMPCRWDVDLNAPRDDEPADDPEAEAA